MSTGHLKFEEKPKAEMYEVLGERDTAKLYARKVLLDTSCDWAYAGGNSVDGRTVYVDRTLHQDVMAGRVAVQGMTAQQIIQAWIEHEHSEWAIDAGDNPVDAYLAAHGHAQAKEHDLIRQLGVNADRYEDAIRPALKACIKRFIRLGTKANPPRDVWCGPVLDSPDDDDKEIIRILRAKGVPDAFKKSKLEVRYGVGQSPCSACTMFGDGDMKSGIIRQCEAVCGIVRANRHCDLWKERK